MFLACSALLMPAFSLLSAPPVLAVGLPRYRTLPYHNPTELGVRSFGDRLEPRYIFGAESLDQ